MEMDKFMARGSKGNSTCKSQDAQPPVSCRHIMHAQKKDSLVSKYLELGFPLVVQDRIKGIEARLWEKLYEETLNSKIKGIEEWVMDPGNDVS